MFLTKFLVNYTALVFVIVLLISLAIVCIPAAIMTYLQRRRRDRERHERWLKGWDDFPPGGFHSSSQKGKP